MYKWTETISEGKYLAGRFFLSFFKDKSTCVYLVYSFTLVWIVGLCKRRKLNLFRWQISQMTEKHFAIYVVDKGNFEHLRWKTVPPID